MTTICYIFFCTSFHHYCGAAFLLCSCTNKLSHFSREGRKWKKKNPLKYLKSSLKSSKILTLKICFLHGKNRETGWLKCFVSMLTVTYIAPYGVSLFAYCSYSRSIQTNYLCILVCRCFSSMVITLDCMAMLDIYVALVKMPIASHW